MGEKRSCFVISPIGESGSEIRKRSDQILKHVIDPAADACGYKAVRADQIAEPGLITSQVIQHVVQDDLVIADLSDRNPNVYYELAVRHAIRKPLVQIIRKGEPLPFDVAGLRTVLIDHKDLDSVETAKQEIAEQIKAIEKDPSKIDTPISISLDLQMLKQSENPEERSLGDVLTILGELRSGMASIEKRLGAPTELLPPEYLSQVLGRYRRYPPVSSVAIVELRECLRALGAQKDISPELRARLESITELLHRRGMETAY